MLPRSTGSRMDREAAKGKQGGRTFGNSALDWTRVARGGGFKNSANLPLSGL